MTYKDCLLFVGRCLTLSLDDRHFQFVKSKLSSDSFDWDSVVKLSSKHYVIPALYQNLRQSKLLSFLPNELLNLMRDLSKQNQLRNERILEQVKELDKLLKTKGIEAIFIKGSGLLAQDLFNTISERMIGDIDFLVSPSNLPMANGVLLENGYLRVKPQSYQSPLVKHLPRLYHPNRIAAVEIHKELTIGKFTKYFNYKIVAKNKINHKGLFVLSHHDQLKMAIIANQINDRGRYYLNMPLRNAYDLLMLSNTIETRQILREKNILFNHSNHFIARCSYIFQASTLKFYSNKKAEKYLKKFERLLNKDQLRSNRTKRVQRLLFISKRLSLIIKAMYQKEYRVWLWNRVRDKEWQARKIEQIRAGFIR